MTQALGPNQLRWLEQLEDVDPSMQAMWRLCNQYGHMCCLGVACNLFFPDDKRPHLKGGFQWFDEDQNAPWELQEILALRGEEGEPLEGSDNVSLIDLNDSEHKTFAEIAAIIRSDPSVYFTEPR